ncbi:hypothetical protein H2248_003000 [Termitomyces sp. 'cryptogamus']|nr:hypothetical protein H2248_003000 [Termitomyces sp. 'cryptogamus']
MIPSTSQHATSPLASCKASILVNTFLEGLDDEVIDGMAFDCSSSFSSLEASPVTFPLQGPVPGLYAPTQENPSSTREGKPSELLPPPGPATSKAPLVTTQTPTFLGSNSNPFIWELAITKSPLPTSDVGPCTLPLQPCIQKANLDGHPLCNVLQKCQERFTQIKGVFVELANLLDWPVSQVKKWFSSIIKGSRTTSEWNLYQAYLFRHHEEELQHCDLQDSTGTQPLPMYLLAPNEQYRL